MVQPPAILGMEVTGKDIEMKIGKQLLAGTGGISLMTIFSYATSVITKQNFSEPALLASFIQYRLSSNKKQLALPLGWAVHYMLGNAWHLIYQQTLQKTNKKPNKINGLLFGLSSGAVGVALWKMIFKLHPKPSRITYNWFLLHLFVAQVINITTATALTRKLNCA
jgi:hypothetical protein